MIRHGEGIYGNAVGVTTPLEHRLAQAGQVVKTGVNTIRPGLFWDGSATVVSGTASMAYSVRAFTAALSRGATDGAVFLANDGAVTVTTTAAPGSNSRIDIIYVWQRDYAADGTNSDPVIGVVQGTAAASPTAPSLAAFPGAVELGRATVSAGATATNGAGVTISQTAPFTAMAGGIVAARTATERDGYVPASADLTAKCWVIADGITYRWSGAAWRAWESDWFSATPLVTAQSGSFVSVNASLRWKYSAGVVVYLISITVGSAGTASGNITVAMPFTAAFTAAAGGMNQSTGTSIWGVIFSGESVLRINSYNNSGAIGTGNLLQASGIALV